MNSIYLHMTLKQSFVQVFPPEWSPTVTESGDHISAS